MGWGVQDYIDAGGTSGGNVAATVGGQEIGVQELSRAYRSDLQRQDMQSIDPETARQLGLARRTLQRMVTAALFDAETDALGLTATDAMVRGEIASEDTFRNQFGEFDRDVFQRTLARAGISEPQYVESLRGELAREQLAQAAAQGVPTAPALVDALYSYHGATRSALAATVPLPDASAIDAPDPGTLRSFYDDNKQRFEQPAFRELSYIHLAPEDLLEEIEVPEAELRDAYEARRGSYTKPERRTIQQMLLPDEETAQRAARRVAEGADFATVAAEVANVDAETLELGTFSRSEIPDETLAETAFGLAEGVVSEPVQGNFGWFLVKVSEVEDGAVTPFESVRDQIRRDLALDEAIDRVYDLSKRIDEAFGQGLSLEETADRVALSVETVEAVSRQGNAPSGETVDGLPPGVSFLEIAFETPVGEPSFLEETASNGYFVLRVDGETPPRVPPLAEIEDRVEAAWREDRRDALAEQRAETLADQAKSQGGLAAAAESAGLETREISQFGRDGTGDGGRLPGSLAGALFDARVGGIDYAATDDGYVVAEVTAETPAAEAAGPSLRDNIRQSLGAGLSAGIVDELAAALRQRHEVTINDGAVDRVY